MFDLEKVSRFSARAHGANCKSKLVITGKGILETCLELSEQNIPRPTLFQDKEQEDRQNSERRIIRWGARGILVCIASVDIVRVLRRSVPEVVFIFIWSPQVGVFLDCFRAGQVGQVEKGGHRTHFMCLTTNSSSWNWSWKSNRVKEFANHVDKGGAKLPLLPNDVLSWFWVAEPIHKAFFCWNGTMLGLCVRGAAPDYMDFMWICTST